MQRIIVLGAGAVGSYYGALLAGRNDVLLIGRGPHVETVNSKGLILTGAKEGHFKVKAAEKVEEIRPETLILLTTKAYDSEEAILTIREKLRTDTVILILQNGLGNEEIVRRAARGGAEVIRGLVASGLEFNEPGKIDVKMNGETVLEKSKTGQWIGEVLKESGLRVRLSDDMTLEVWRKLVMNCVINPLTAILRVPDNEISVKELCEVRRAIVEECVEVAMAEHVSMEMSILEDVEHVIPSYTNLSSMYQDIAKGKRTEIDYLNGRIVEFGKKHGIRTPVNMTMVSLVKALEARK